MDYQRLKEEHPELEKRLTAMEMKGKKAEILLALQENAVVKDIINECRSAIEAVNTELLTKEMSDRERDKRFIERHAWEWFLWKFTGAKRTLKNNDDFLKKYD